VFEGIDDRTACAAEVLKPRIITGASLELAMMTVDMIGMEKA
jgi:hypothetical protein